MSQDNSLNTAANPETTTGPSETPDTTPSERNLRAEIAAALNLDDTPEEPVATEATTETVAAETPAETQVAPTHEAPATWPAEKRELFAKLEPEMQAFVLTRESEREADYTRKTQELADQRKAAEEITSVLEPYKQSLELAGVSPGQAIQRLFAAQRLLETRPLDGLKWLAQQYQVDLSGLSSKEDEAYVDPALKGLRDEVTQLKSQLTQRQQQEQQQNVSAVQKQITDFKDSKNEDGTPKYPHFDKIKAVMAPLVNEGKTLAEAYEVARYTLPEEVARIRDEVAKTAQAEALKKAEEARKAKAKEAKVTTPVIRSRNAGVEDEGKAGSLRQELVKNLASQKSGRI